MERHARQQRRRRIHRTHDVRRDRAARPHPHTSPSSSRLGGNGTTASISEWIVRPGSTCRRAVGLGRGQRTWEQLALEKCTRRPIKPRALQRANPLPKEVLGGPCARRRPRHLERARGRLTAYIAAVQAAAGASSGARTPTAAEWRWRWAGRSPGEKTWPGGTSRSAEPEIAHRLRHRLRPSCERVREASTAREIG